MSDAAPDPGKVTALLGRIRDGDGEARDELFPIVRERLAALASRAMARQNSGHTLQPTALIDDAFVHLTAKERDWKDSCYFFAIAATTMRELLIQHARHKGRLKRGQGRMRVTLDEGVVADGDPGSDFDVENLDSALEELAKIKPRLQRIVDCRFFGGMTIDETATALSISPRTVRDDWKFARAWLRRALSA